MASEQLWVVQPVSIKTLVTQFIERVLRCQLSIGCC